MLDDYPVLLLELLELSTHILDVLVLRLELLLPSYELGNHICVDLTLLLLCQTSFLCFLVGE